jgi:ATP-binding cassette subfamily B protein
MLIWAVEAWRAGLNEAGDVVLISALTFRILHGSRELALSLVDASQHFGVIAEMLRVVAVPHEVADRPDAPAFAARPGRHRLSRRELRLRRGAPDLRAPGPVHSRRPAAGRGRPFGRGQVDLVRLIGRVMDVTARRVTVDGVTWRACGRTACATPSAWCRRT